MRFFFLTYDNQENYETSTRLNVAGSPSGKGKFDKLKQGDVIIFRVKQADSKEIYFKGAGLVVGKPVNQAEDSNSPFDAHLWSEEKAQNTILFPYRVQVSFENAPKLKNLSSIRWSDLLSIELPDKEGKPKTKQKLGKFLSGNFLRHKIDEFKLLAGYEEKTPPFSPSFDDEKNILILPEEVENPEAYKEGSTTQIYINAHERNPKARLKCIEHYGSKCSACGFNFETTYGGLGKNYIHVHHIKPLAEIDHEYTVDPVNDLRPVCPNCHAMLHRKRETIRIAELKSILSKQRSNQ